MIRALPWGWIAFRFVFSWLSNVVAIFVASLIFSGIDYGSFWILVLAGLVFSVVNWIVRPILVFLALPAVILTLGLGLFVINALMLLLTDEIVSSFDVSGFWTALGGAVIIAIVNGVLAAVLRPDRQRSRPDGHRPGLQ